MGVLSILVIAVLVFAICFLADKGFTRLFRGKAQHRSGLAVRANKRYGSFGVILLVLGILSVCLGFGSDKVLLVGGGMVAVMGEPTVRRNCPSAAASRSWMLQSISSPEVLKHCSVRIHPALSAILSSVMRRYSSCIVVGVAASSGS